MRARQASCGARPGPARPRRCRALARGRARRSAGRRSEPLGRAVRVRVTRAAAAATGRASRRRCRACCTAARSAKRPTTRTTRPTSAAKSSLGKLSGTRKAELGAVLANVQAMAAAGELIPSRLPALFLTLERNRQWWTTEPLLSGDERVSFPASKLVWEYYPGQGIEIQWLATFGEANGYYLVRPRKRATCASCSAKSSRSRPQRAGGIAWEYMFHFDGGAPPWTSGLSQGTAAAGARARLVALQGTGLPRPPRSRRSASSRRRRRRACACARRPARSTPSTPTRPATASSTASSRRWSGSTTTPRITKDPLGLALFEAGDAEARAEVPLLRHRRLVAVRPVRRIEPQLPRTAHRIPPAPVRTHAQGAALHARPPRLRHAHERRRRQRHRRGRRTLAQAAPASADPGDGSTARPRSASRADLHTPPVIALLSKTLPGGARAGVQLSLSKISTVALTVRQGARVVWTQQRHRRTRQAAGCCGSRRPSGGTFSVTLARDRSRGQLRHARPARSSVSRHVARGRPLRAPRLGAR